MEEREVEKRIQQALEAHKRGFNCAQCVACTCCDLVGLDETTAFKLFEGFGRGMGNHTQTCGALSGAVAIVSYAKSDGPDNPTTKHATYEAVDPLVEDFRRLAGGSTICADIKYCTDDPAINPCDSYIAIGVRLVISALS